MDERQITYIVVGAAIGGVYGLFSTIRKAGRSNKASATVTQTSPPPKLDNPAAASSTKANDYVSTGNALRVKMLETPADSLGIKQTDAFPRVYGVIMDWNVQNQISMTFALCDGNASIYGPMVGVSDSLVHKRVRDAAINAVQVAEKRHDDAVPAFDYAFPQSGSVRFYLLCFTGVRVIEVTQRSLEAGADKCSPLWKATQILISEISKVVRGFSV
jgi:hypothetical protein